MKKVKVIAVGILILHASIAFSGTTALQHQIETNATEVSTRLSKEIGKEITLNMQKPDGMSLSDFRQEKRETKANIEATIKSLKGNSRQVKIQKIILEDYLVNL
jgi:hypothetical protein